MSPFSQSPSIRLGAKAIHFDVCVDVGVHVSVQVYVYVDVDVDPYICATGCACVYSFMKMGM